MKHHFSAGSGARAAFGAGDPRGAVDLIRSVAAVTAHAGIELQGERERLLKEALRARMLARIGIRRGRTASTQRCSRRLGWSFHDLAKMLYW